MRRIHSFSANKKIQYVINDIAEKLLGHVMAFSMLDVEIFSEYEKNLQSEDLIIIDATGELPSEEIQKALTWASTQKQRIAITTLLITPYPGSLPPGLKIPNVDAQLSVNLLEGREGAGNILGFLYRHFKTSPKRLSETEEVLRLMGIRGASILLGELIQFSNNYEAPDDAEKRPEQMLFDAREIMSDKDFNEIVADRLAAELQPLLWVYVSEALIKSGMGKFDALGKFASSYAGGNLSIAFEPDDSFADAKGPELEFSTFGLSELGVRGVVASFPHYPLLIYNLLSMEAGRKQDWESFLAATLWNTSRSIVWNPDYVDVWNPDYVDVFGHAAAFVSYYAGLTVASRSLSTDKQLDIPMIGGFFREGSAVTFKPATELLELIDANPRSISKPA